MTDISRRPARTAPTEVPTTPHCGTLLPADEKARRGFGRCSGGRAGAGGQARPEETSHCGKLPAATEEEEEEGDAALHMRPVRTVANDEAERDLRKITARKTTPDVSRPRRAEDRATPSSAANAPRKWD